MKMKKLSILFLVLLCIISIVSAGDSFYILEDSKNLSGERGDQVSDSFTVINNGTTSLTLSFTGLNLTNGSNVLNVSPIINESLNVNQSKSINFDIDILSNQAFGVYTGILNASNGNVSDTLQLKVEVTPSFSLSASPISINFDNAKRNETRGGTFTITNDGNGDLTGVTPSSTLDSKYNIDFKNLSAFDLNIRQSKTITFSVLIPENEPTTDHSVGTVGVNSNEFNDSSLVNLNIDIKGGLIVKDFDVRINYRNGGTDFDTNIQDGQSLQFKDDDQNDVRPGSELEFKLNIANTFTDNDEDPDIEDITVTITIVEIDDEEDIDEESDEFSLDPDEEKRVSLFFDIPLEIEEKTFDVIVEIEGEDDEGVTHRIIWNLDLQTDKQRREIIIRRATLTQNTLSCERNTRFNFAILNIGSKEEDEVKAEAFNKEIGFNFVEDDIILDVDPFEDDDEFSKSLTINVDDKIKAGTYPITLNAYIHDEIIYETKKVNLIIKDCGNGEIEEEEVIEEDGEDLEEEEKEEDIDVAVEPDEVDEEEEGVKIPVLTGKVTETKEVSIAKPIYVVFLLIAIIAIVVGVLVALRIKTKEEF